ncbi:hypothetical protein HZH68_001520 [Vespula germanica]|uniref:Uncharacterized protein n=1 Tax=Vespula germanica TaxID=30212 RepID=A0A834NVN8_VESGE|nr:hypothetical protein HZH68_001520 [Vespula germanica]
MSQRIKASEFDPIQTFATQVSYQVNYWLLGYSSMRALDVPAVGVNVVAGDSDGSGGVALAVAFAITSIPICVTCLKPQDPENGLTILSESFGDPIEFTITIRVRTYSCNQGCSP